MDNRGFIAGRDVEIPPMRVARRGYQHITAEAARGLLERLEAARDQGKILLCSPGIAGRLIAKFQSASLEELDGALGVGVLPLAFIDDGRPSVLNRETVEDYFYDFADAGTRERLGLKEPTWRNTGF